MTGVAHSHCSYCGSAYPAEATWPRACPTCGGTVWRNPLPVAVAVAPVRTATGLGVVVVRRDIEPARGLLALPGGFIEYGEEWRDALVRELREETGLHADAAGAELIAVHSAPAGGTIMIFGMLPVRPADELPPSAPTAEATEWLVLTEPTELAFSTHTQVLDDFFARQRD
ncbi:ADP-ribose pyrophosphatase YjhB, NUDIX family [Micromonospora phaseoli]|uniref:ADP-ribose pyrophosphatase YjhB, NUDIX family n=1 Tax=Micromonospora phaseoli TaxID=1144548 RepID=A0A1H6YF21_9ACTN|nr:NUDIX domain-containing protein [Micromonospora phaseoli]PZW00173.1 ADP-ribose pyrophosphatase YjhB (NUDIX family) [Micromonospora phaseoli]GIJ78879.1 NUDIX hydrolase [Micromonospora phaseoli]SEJ39888.1 ADP-ribose pyrophosphatase YjhB, NUDIX family [Micromonospora phaseoli]